MNIEERLQELKREECPVKVDVVDSVMRQIKAEHTSFSVLRSPFSTPHSSLKKVVTWGGSLAAAAVVALLIINTLIVSPVAPSDRQFGSMIASLNDYSCYAPVEDAALEPLDFLYVE